MSTYVLKREMPFEKGWDLIVAGGGPAGSAAAICAARLGARVLLVEATGCLGGMGTSGLVCAFDPMADGRRMLVGGFMREVVETMQRRGFLGPQVTPDFYNRRYHCWTPFQPEGLKLLLDELAVAAGVEVRFGTRVIDAEAGGGMVRGVVLHNMEGLRFVTARTFIDATGDAVLAALCGAACRQAGRDTPRPMPATLCSLHAGIDWARLNAADVKQWQAIHKAVDEGHFTQPDRHLPGLSQIGVATGYLNGGHIFDLDALDCRSMTEGLMLGRRLAREYLAFYRKYLPGCEAMELVCTASLMGVRESRRIVGEYELTLADYLARRQFPDQIGVFNKFVDVHPYDCSPEEFARLNREKETCRLGEGECFGLPYGILVPRGWKNLWVAGRCASSDIPVHGSIRVMPAAAMMGQAAGTAAVQALRRGESADDLDTAELVATLRAAGAYLPQAASSRAMTR
jgi:hypothetical protein